MHQNYIKPLIEEMNILVTPRQLLKRLKNKINISLLESTLTHKKLGRYSIFCLEPFMILRSKGNLINISGYKCNREYFGDPFVALSSLLKEYNTVYENDELPFLGGAVGYLGYDLCHFVERLPNTTLDDLMVPDMLMAFYDKAIIWDHIEYKMYLIATGLREEKHDKQRKAANDDLKMLTDLVKGSFVNDLNDGDTFGNISPQSSVSSLCSNFSKEEYEDVVRKAKEYIAAGDIFQVNLSQRFHMSLNMEPLELYIKLSKLNPAPFGGLLHFPDITVASSSPERFLSLDGNIVETRPIKGTIPRGKNKAEDEALKKKLLKSEKDNAEHIMIVDLERNDLGRVCKYGTVKPTELCVIEKYATVHHLVSTVKGQLQKDKTNSDLLKATFPGGSITGAPKVRAMEIIDELEPVKRGVYTGSIGYMGFNGKIDMNIVIRTFIVKDSNVYFQVGGGIVADSSPEGEYQETLDKGKALMKTLGF